MSYVSSRTCEGSGAGEIFSFAFLGNVCTFFTFSPTTNMTVISNLTAEKCSLVQKELRIWRKQSL